MEAQGAALKASRPQIHARARAMQGWPLMVAIVGFLFAGAGVWADIAWHIDFGRDIKLLTPPHTSIVVGLQLIAFAAGAALFLIKPQPGAGILFGGREYSLGAVFALLCSSVGLAAFPIDAIWHELFGLDLTEWSPTHLLLITGPVFSLIGFLMLAQDLSGRLGSHFASRAMLLFFCSAILVGLSILQAEFDFGISPFNLLIQPVLIVATAGFALVLARQVLGRFAALFVASVSMLAAGLLALPFLLADERSVPWSPLYLAAALIVEGAFWSERGHGWLATVAAGVGIGTVGLGGEWLWVNATGPHAWPTTFLPEVALLSIVAAVAAATLARTCAVGVSNEGRRVPSWATRAAFAVLVIALAIPLVKAAPTDSASIAPVERSRGSSGFAVELDSPDAARGASVFEVVSAGGGSTKRISLERTAPGHYVTTRPVPISRERDVILRLAKGNVVGFIPLALGGDEPGEERIVPKRKFAAFESESAIPAVSGAKVRQQKLAYLAIAAIFVSWMVVLSRVLRPAARLASGSH